jgi:DNA-binding ferritin-like protein
MNARTPALEYMGNFGMGPSSPLPPAARPLLKKQKVLQKQKAPPEASARDNALSLMLDILCLLKSLRDRYQMEHWMAAGPSFYGDHLMFQRLYEETDALIDPMAERIAQTFGSAQLRGLQQDLGFPENFRSHVMLELTVRIIRQARSTFERAGRLSYGMDDFLMAMSNSLETQLYLLQQSGRKSPKAEWSAPHVCEHGHVHEEPHVCGVDCHDDGLTAKRRKAMVADGRDSARKMAPHLNFAIQATGALLDDPFPRTADDDLTLALRKAVVAAADLAKLAGHPDSASKLQQQLGKINVTEAALPALQPDKALFWARKAGMPTGPLSEGVVWLGRFLKVLAGTQPHLYKIGGIVQQVGLDMQGPFVATARRR